MMKILVMESAKKTNYFPNIYGISKYFSPRQLLTHQSLDYERDCKYYFGQFVQAHDDETKPRNSQQARSIDAIYMRPTDGGHEVYNFATDEVITRVRVTPLPIPKHVIDTIDRIAADQGQKGLKVQARNGDVLYDSTWTPGVDYESDDDSDEDEDFDSDEEDSDLEDEDSDSDTDITLSTDSSSRSSEDSEEARDLLYEETDRGPVQQESEQPTEQPIIRVEDVEEEEDEGA